MRRLLTLIVVVVVLAMACGSTEPDQSTEPGDDAPASTGAVEPAAASAYGPHYPTPGPWFEGWYTRITDEDGSRSLAVVVSSHLPADTTYTRGMALPGYIAVLASEGDGAPTLSFEAFPEETYATIDGEPADPSYALTSVDAFEWTAPGFGTVTQSGIDLSIPERIAVRTQWRDPIGWDNRFTPPGPEGILGGLPLPLHWHVESFGSRAQYQYVVGPDGAVVAGDGYAHQEKNWGSAFPIAWIWAQGVDEDNEAHFVLGGGDVQLGPTTMRAWIVGFRSPEIALDFDYYTPGTLFETSIDACAGTFAMEAADPRHTLIVEASGPIDTFGSVSIPTAEGFETDAGGESFSADVTVSAYQHDPVSGLLGPGELVTRQQFDNAALEFGADFDCQD